MKIAVIQFPGTNCERETALAVKRANMTPVDFLWNAPHYILRECDGYILAGGFSYEDRSRAGIIAAMDPVIKILKEESEKGKPILGICNGAQILVETGLVPGVENNRSVMALTQNRRIQQNKILGTGYYNAWVNMRLSDHFQLNAFTKHLTHKNILKVPVAHGEGRFVIAPALLEEMHHNGLTLFQYCSEQGDIVNEFPVNPNGSILNLAAVSNKAGNVMAMMPHPERTTAGDPIFASMRDTILQRNYQKVTPLHYSPRPLEIKHYQPQGAEWLVDLIITDNAALTVQNALRQSGFPVSIKRFSHWELQGHTASLEKLKTNGLLFNPQKEKLVTKPKSNHLFLTRIKEDTLGEKKLQQLQNHMGVDDVHSISHGTLWQIEGDEQIINDVIQSHILFNPQAYEYYRY